jgi:lipoate-protein ligase A
MRQRSSAVRRAARPSAADNRSLLTVIDRAGFDPAANLAYEEALFLDARAWPRPLLLFYVNDPCVVLGRANPEGEWVNRAACEADGVPVLRRFSGGGTVFHDRDNLNYSFILPRDSLDAAVGQPGVHAYIAIFRRLVIGALSRVSAGFSETGLSDISLRGYKVSGNAQRIASNIVLHHGTLMLRCPLEAIERYLPVPPNRPGIAHRGFVGGLHELGLQCSMAQVKDLVTEEFRAAL